MISESASTALGTVATICWCVQLIPQIWYNWKRKDCTGLPPIMMFLWVVSGIPFGIYFCISAPNVILQVQPHLFMIFCAISFAQTCYYPPAKMNRLKIVIIMLAVVLCDIGMEVGFILWLKPLYKEGTKWPDLIFGILASVLLAVGLLPPYYELAKRNGRVVGINFWFLFVDSLGAWLSIVSVVVGNMDVMGIILYCIIAGMELGIFLSHFIWCCRFQWFGNDKKHADDTISVNHDDYENHDQETVHSNIESFKDKPKGDSNQNHFSITSHTRTLGIGGIDDDDDMSSFVEEFEMDEPVVFREESSGIHTIHGIAMNSKSSSTGTIRI